MSGERDHVPTRERAPRPRRRLIGDPSGVCKRGGRLRRRGLAPQATSRQAKKLPRIKQERNRRKSSFPFEEFTLASIRGFPASLYKFCGAWEANKKRPTRNLCLRNPRRWLRDRFVVQKSWLKIRRSETTGSSGRGKKKNCAG